MGFAEAGSLLLMETEDQVVSRRASLADQMQLPCYDGFVFLDAVELADMEPIITSPRIIAASYRARDCMIDPTALYAGLAFAVRRARSGPDPISPHESSVGSGPDLDQPGGVKIGCRSGVSFGRRLTHCWANARRKLIEITRIGPAPIAENGVTLIRHLSAIEADIRHKDPAARLAARQARFVPILNRIDNWLRRHRARATAESALYEAFA